MHIYPALPQPVRLASLFVRRFLPWYFLLQPAAIFRMYLAYASAFLQVFSFIFLLKTLFSPWKGIADTYPDNLFQVVRVSQVFTLNCTARVVGAVVRLITIAVGIIVQSTLVVVFAAMLITWIAFPGFVLFGVHYLFQALASA
jgi:hypothetical protein